MLIKVIITAALIVLPIWGIIKTWTVPPQDILYSIKEHKGVFYIERDYGVYGIDYFGFTDSDKIDTYFTYEIREAKKFKTLEDAEKMIKGNFGLIKDFSDELVTKKEFSNWQEAHDLTMELIEAAREGDYEKEKELVKRINTIYGN